MSLLVPGYSSYLKEAQQLLLLCAYLDSVVIHNTLSPRYSFKKVNSSVRCFIQHQPKCKHCLSASTFLRDCTNYPSSSKVLYRLCGGF
jgi:hypothetical protein